MTKGQDKNSKSKNKNEKTGQPKKKKFELFNVEKEDEKKEVASIDTTSLESIDVSATGHKAAIAPEPPEPTVEGTGGAIPSGVSLPPVGLIRPPSGVKSVQAVAADILGVSSPDKFKKAILPISKTEFRYCEYGVMLRFLKDAPKDKQNKKWTVVNGQDTRRICVPAAYWLIDKLSADTSEELFYSPGREGIRR